MKSLKNGPIHVGNWTLTNNQLFFDNVVYNYPIDRNRLGLDNYWGWTEQLKDKPWLTEKDKTDFHQIYGINLKINEVNLFIKG